MAKSFFSPKAGDINSLNLRVVFLSTAVSVKETFKPMVCRFPAYSLFMDIQIDCCVRVGFMFSFFILSMVHAWFVTSLVASFL